MDRIRVVVSGSGYMGQEVLAACCREEDMEPVGVLEKFARGISMPLPDGSGEIPLSSEPARLIEVLKPDVIVDFSNAGWTPEVVDAGLADGCRLVIGTTGLSAELMGSLAQGCAKAGIGAVVAPNFAIGAVLMIHMARLAAPYFDYAEITEMHQERKLDAPSGTAVATAQEMVLARGRPFQHTLPEKDTLPGARGAEYEGIAIHSQRMPGFVAHQEVALGGLGQTLRIRHDSTGRDSFIPGVLLAVREVMKRKDLTVGLDKLIGL